MDLPVIPFAFATSGDKCEIPWNEDSKKHLSWEKGFTSLYSQNPETGGQYITRESVNTIFNKITSWMVEYQKHTIFPYQESVGSSTGYAKNQRVLVYYNTSTGQLIDYDAYAKLPEDEALYCTEVTVISQVDNNNTSPLVATNLFNQWIVSDGTPLGGIKLLCTHQTSLPGYLDLGNVNANTIKYNLSDYPRVKALLKKGTKFSCLKVHEENGEVTTFSIDCRGLFMRLFNEEADVDKGRTFNEPQEHSQGALYGEFFVAMGRKYNDRAGADHYERISNITCFVTKPNAPVQNVFKSIRKSTKGAKIDSAGTDEVSFGLDGYPYKDINEGLRAIGGNVLVFDTTSLPNVGDENRPSNFCVKAFLKV